MKLIFQINLVPLLLSMECIIMITSNTLKTRQFQKQIPSPEQHVVSIPLDIEDNISLDDNNFTTNSEQ